MKKQFKPALPPDYVGQLGLATLTLERGAALAELQARLNGDVTVSLDAALASALSDARRHPESGANLGPIQALEGLRLDSQGVSAALTTPITLDSGPKKGPSTPRARRLGFGAGAAPSGA